MNGFYLALLALLGACIGSFINAVVYRLPRRASPLSGHSACPDCKHALSWCDLIPVLSFLALAGRCRYCGGRIAWRYPAVEFSGAVLFAAGWLLVPDWRELLIYLAVVSFFLALFVYDLYYYLVPDKISLPAIATILSLNLAFGRPAFSLLAGAALGASWFLAQFAVSKGRWVGGGDIRLGLLIGALLGWPRVWLGLMLSYIAGSLVALVLIAFGRKTLKSRLPFATILLPATLVVWLWGEGIWRWYLGAFGF